MTQVAAQQAIVTTAAGGVRLVAAIPQSQQVLISNRDAANSLFVGPAGVTPTTGAEVKPGQNWANAFVTLPPETEVWATVATTSVRADVSQIIAS